MFSDLHAHNHAQYSEILPNGRNSRLQHCVDIIHQATSIVRSQKIDHVFFLGDMFESRTKLDIDVITAVYDALRGLAEELAQEAERRLFILIGNHDQYNKVGGIYSVRPFEQLDGVQVVSTPWITNVYRSYFPNGDLESVQVAFYPHTSDVPGMKKWIQEMPEVDLFLFHQGISEAAVGPYDMHIKTEISLGDLPLNKTKLCIAGDFHKRQFLADGRFHYIGSPLQLSFGERNDCKCFSLVDTASWTVESIETNAPKFFEFKSKEEFDSRPFPDLLSNAFVRVYCKTEQEVSAVKATISKAQAVLEDKPVEIIDRSKGIDLNDDKQLLQAWMKTQGEDELELLEVGMSLLGVE